MVTMRSNVDALIAAGDVRAPGLAKRREQIGARHALSPLAETRIGRARLLGMITEGQYRAAIQFEAVVQLCRITQGLGLGNPQSVCGLRLGGGALSGRDFTEETIEKAKRRYGKAYAALDSAGRHAHMVTVGVVFRSEVITDETLAGLRMGLNKLSDHFNRGGRGGHSSRVLTWHADGRVSIDPRFWEDTGADSKGVLPK